MNCKQRWLCFGCLFSFVLILNCEYAVAQTSYYLNSDTASVLIDSDEDGNKDDEHTAIIDMRNPSTGDDDGHGTLKRYPTGSADKTNCDNGQYPYYVSVMDDDWVGVVTLPDGTEIEVNKTDCQRYWDWVYEGYEKITDVDHAQNCHGYSFGVGNWPDTAVKLLNTGPFPMGGND